MNYSDLFPLILNYYPGNLLRLKSVCKRFDTIINSLQDSMVLVWNGDGCADILEKNQFKNVSIRNATIDYRLVLKLSKCYSVELNHCKLSLLSIWLLTNCHNVYIFNCRWTGFEDLSREYRFRNSYKRCRNIECFCHTKSRNFNLITSHINNEFYDDAFNNYITVPLVFWKSDFDIVDCIKNTIISKIVDMLNEANIANENNLVLDDDIEKLYLERIQRMDDFSINTTMMINGAIEIPDLDIKYVFKIYQLDASITRLKVDNKFMVKYDHEYVNLKYTLVMHEDSLFNIETVILKLPRRLNKDTFEFPHLYDNSVFVNIDSSYDIVTICGYNSKLPPFISS